MGKFLGGFYVGVWACCWYVVVRILGRFWVCFISVFGYDVCMWWLGFWVCLGMFYISLGYDVCTCWLGFGWVYGSVLCRLWVGCFYVLVRILGRFWVGFM